MVYMWGEKLKRIHEELGPDNDKDVAEAIDVKPSSFSTWIRASDPPLHFIEKVCKYYNIKLYDFFSEPDDDLGPQEKLTELEKIVLLAAKRKLSLDDQKIFWDMVHKMLLFKIGERKQ